MREGKKKAGKVAFRQLAKAATNVIIQSGNADRYRNDAPTMVAFRVPFFATFADDFPRRYVVENDNECTVYKVSAVALLDWLHKHGHSPFDSKGVMKQIKEVNSRIAAIERMIEGVEPNEQEFE